MSQPERAEQAKVVQWWGLFHDLYKLPEFALYSVPNGATLAGNAQRRAIQMNNLKRTGLRPGILDLNLDARSPRDKTAMGLRLELKIKPNKPSEEQEAVIMYLRKQGYHVVVAWDAEEAIRAIKGYLGD